jgi:hypothetical protein
VQDIDVHGEFKKRVVTLLVMSFFKVFQVHQELVQTFVIQLRFLGLTENCEDTIMSNINIENLSYDMNMDRDAMDAIAGSGWGWISRVKRLVTGRLVGQARSFIRRTLFRYF